MLAVILFMFFVNAYGHSNKLLHDADLQSALIPQELNPTFVPDKVDSNVPWKISLPMRYRRSNVPQDLSNNVQLVKKYSRTAACVVLVLSTIVEIVLYVVEFYYVL
ncbi:uncharacterized protein LOC131841542 [Achroia grisella]|uniref:uncharacterized protein LOC131841542 n=1 Tax=Achroia grisella TaxID=688607 RepID=UPI0027D2971E|nr:uncharacterized protein LOC131841542 [Achroia grisella]